MSIHKWSFRSLVGSLTCPITALRKKNNPRNIKHMPVVIFSRALILNKNPYLWMDTNYNLFFYMPKFKDKILMCQS